MSDPQSGLQQKISPQALAVVLLVPVSITLFAVGLFPVRDGGDQWWHLKTGKYLLEVKFNFPEEDVFSFTGKGHRWANHEWLADTLMYLGYRTFGLRGLILLKCTVLLVAFLLVGLLIYRRTGHLLWSMLGAVMAAWTSQYSVHLRPPVLTYLMMALFLHLMLNLERGKSVRLNQIYCFLLMVLWINLHGGAILGIIISGAFFSGNLMSWFAGGMTRKPLEELAVFRQLTRRFGLNLVLVILASLCNPFTYQIHLLTLKVMQSKHLTGLISELQMPNLHHTTGYLLLVLFLVLFGLMAIRRVKPAEGLLVMFFLHQSLNHVRHLPLFAIVVTPILFETIVCWHRGLLEHSAAAVRRSGGVLLKILPVLILLLCFRVIRENWTGRIQLFFSEKQGYVRQGAPHDAVDFVIHHKIPGPMYNPINFSGLLIWRLSPEYTQTFTDSRFDIFGDQVILDCLAIENAQAEGPDPESRQAHFLDMQKKGDQRPYWAFALDKYEINFMILARDCRLHWVLNHFPNSGWAKVYEDFGYAVYVKDVAENSEVIQRSRLP